MAAVTFTTQSNATTRNRFVTRISLAGGGANATLANATILAALPAGPLKTLLGTTLTNNAAAFNLLFANPYIKTTLTHPDYLAGEGNADADWKIEPLATAAPLTIKATGAAGDDDITTAGLTLSIEYRHSTGR